MQMPDAATPPAGAIPKELTLFRFDLTRVFQFAMTHLFSVNKWLLVTVLCALSATLTYLSSSLLVNETLLAAFYGNQVSAERVHDLLLTQEKYAWLLIPLTVLTYLVRIFCVACCISLGLFFSNIKHDIRKLLGIVTVSEIILILPPLIKLCWFAFFHQDYTLREVQFFFPLSILNFFDPAGLDNLLVYPLQLLNAFEAVYVLLIALGVYACGYVANIQRSLKINAISYGVGLLAWVLVIAFISVSM